MRFSRRTLGVALAGAVALTSAIPAVAQQASQALSSESVIETIKKRGVIKIGLSLFVPWSMRDKTGELIGFELDVGRKLAEDMGVEAEFLVTSWDGIIPALVAGKFDAIISGMSVTAQRNLTINFTDPYAYSGLTVLANRQMTEGFSLEDFNNEDVIFATRRGATPAVLIPELFPKAQMLPVRRGSGGGPGSVERQRPRDHGGATHPEPGSGKLPRHAVRALRQAVGSARRGFRHSQG